MCFNCGTLLGSGMLLLLNPSNLKFKIGLCLSLYFPQTELGFKFKSSIQVVILLAKANYFAAFSLQIMLVKILPCRDLSLFHKLPHFPW